MAAEYISKFRTNQGDKQLDYKALGNLPTPYGELCANAITGEATGEGDIEITDISPLEHTIQIVLTSSTITDFSAVTVTVFEIDLSSAVNYTPNENGIVKATSFYPTTHISCDTEGVTMVASYNKDIQKALDEAIGEALEADY